jgi:predicted transglutaminase-like cysteine proteinase
MIRLSRILLGLSLLAPLAAESLAKEPPLFNSIEVHSPDSTAFKKWLEALDRNRREAGQTKRSCAEIGMNRCNAGTWQAMIEPLQGRKPSDVLRTVNQFFNKYPYILDSVNWGVEDYWESPGEFLSKAGDCEDYAIIKYMTLKRLGIDPARMRIVAVNDSNLGAGHAVLAVYVEERIFILDNQINDVIDSSKILHYEPIYSINESGWWLHRR